LKQLGTVTLRGKSKTGYPFRQYDFYDTFDEVTCVYVVLSQTNDVLYVGHTENLKQKLSDHNRYVCFISNQANHIGVHLEDDEELRQIITDDLINTFKPICN
jgi:excinuclease UvrABC nuclease subunit